jgi:DNA-binding response OmpR family regulator
MTEILVVEDDLAVSQMLTVLLQRAGYDVTPVPNAAEAWQKVQRGVDLVVLDLGLPDRDGLDLCRDIRNHRPGLPILVVTARTSEPDTVLALDAGADDYVMKPFRSLEFLARVRSLLRRTVSGDLIFAGDIALDAQAMRVTVHGKPLALTRKEFEILSLLMRNLDNAVPRDVLLSALWHEPLPANSKSLDMHLSALRRKLDVAGSNEVVRTLRGVGFRLERQPRD